MKKKEAAAASPGKRNKKKEKKIKRNRKGKLRVNECACVSYAPCPTRDGGKYKSQADKSTIENFI